MIDEDYRVSKVSSSYNTVKETVYQLSVGNVTSLDGAVATPYGFVLVSSEQSYASFRFIWQGREYFKTLHRAMNTKALAIYAGKFARFIAAL